MSADFNFFRVERQDHVATITIDRADRRNALTPEMLVCLREIAESMRGDGVTRAVIIRGDGTDFSVGADIERMGGEAPPVAVMRRVAQNGALMIRAVREIHQPTICLVRGVATGGGACIASACDFRIGTPDARIGYGEHQSDVARLAARDTNGGALTSQANGDDRRTVCFGYDAGLGISR